MTAEAALQPDASRYGRYVGALAIVLVAAFVVYSSLNPPRGIHTLRAGGMMPAFAVPLAGSDLVGDADIATRANEGPAGRVPACQLRERRVLNICQLYEQGPVALVLFVASAPCTGVLDELNSALAAFPGLRGAAVAIRGSRAAASELASRLSFPIGYDRDGAVAGIFGVVVCPQITLAYPGGRIAAPPLLRTPNNAELRRSLTTLYQASLARGWRPPVHR